MVRAVVFCCLFGSYVAKAYENLALGKSAWQQAPASSGYEHSANRALDGRKSNLAELGGECTSSSYYKTTAMWWVDLGTQQNQKNYHSSSFVGFSVYISPTENKEDGLLCFRDTNYTTATIPNPVNITCPYHGRYVIYYNNRTHKPFPDGYSAYAYNDLCEIEVYGCRNLGHYGADCSIPCPHNCLYGVCDIISGGCLGCVAGYKGKTCNEENLALWKSTWQLHPFIDEKYSSSRAVDGKRSNLAWYGGECTASAFRKSTAEWRVDLGKVLSIYQIFIQYATNNQVWGKDNIHSAFFLGFSIYISNTTNKQDGVLCFRDDNYTRATIPNPVNITCPYHGRYVIYYNNRTHPPYSVGYSKFAHNGICELEVYGCPKPGHYGDCARSCPENCVDGVCQILNGTCFGCSMGYKGTMCNKECDNHTFGKECSLICGNCVNGERCNHVDGSCPNGCDPGWFETMCDKECPFGLYGHNCQKNCSDNCGVSRLCDKNTGSCMHACQSGWQGSKCIRECDGGFFGHNCTESCGECFGKEQCHHVNGSCLKGCANGYSGLNCTNDEGIDIQTQIKTRSYISAVLTTAAAAIAIFICGIMYKRMHMLKRKAGVNVASLREYEMETDVVSSSFDLDK